MALTFKEWLSFQEARLKGLKRMMRNRYGDMPNYVLGDLYNTRIGHTMNMALGASSRAKETSPRNGNPTTPTSSLAKLGSDPQAPGKVFQKSGFDNITWTQRPEILTYHGSQGVTPSAFDEETQWRFMDRRFGFREEPRIRSDSERTNTQNQLMTIRGQGNNEPIIVLQTMKGYNLLEGWHRTMNYLLSGAPQDQIQSMEHGDIDSIDFNSWQPVQIMAYIGRGPEVQSALAGTGDYTPAGPVGYEAQP